MKLIIPLTKWPFGFRIGPRKWQDWYRSLVKAVELAKANRGSTILVLSNVHIEGGQHEADTYAKVLQELGCEDFEVIKRGQETIGQIEIIRELVKERPDVNELILISSFLHHFRVRWLARGLKATHITTCGLPIPSNAFVDIVLTILFPLIDLCGKREWFKKMADERRASGKLH